MEKQIEALVQEQIELHDRIARIVENLKKLGQANITPGAVQSRLEMLDSYWEKFEEQHKALKTTRRDVILGHDYVKTDFYGKVEETYLCQKAILLDISSSVTKGPSRKAETSVKVETSSRDNLPRIQLPRFAGKFEDWPSFKDLFQSVVGNEAQISDVEKLHCLKVSLKGEARNLVKNLATTAENYSRAWNILCGYYENKRLLVHACLNKFTSLRRMRSESATELRRILDGVTATASTLESVGRPVSGCEDLFAHLVAELLDSRTRREWEYSIRESSDPPSYRALKQFLEQRVHAIEIMQQPSTTSDAAPNKSHANHVERIVARARAHGRKRNPGRCSMCKENHFLIFCDKYRSKSARERRQHVESNHLCRNCLSRHRVGDCFSKRACSVCSDKHHTSLHGAFRARISKSSRNGDCDTQTRGRKARFRRQRVESDRPCWNGRSRHKLDDCSSRRACSACSDKHRTSLRGAFRKSSRNMNGALNTQWDKREARAACNRSCSRFGRSFRRFDSRAHRSGGRNNNRATRSAFSSSTRLGGRDMKCRRSTNRRDGGGKNNFKDIVSVYLRVNDDVCISAAPYSK